MKVILIMPTFHKITAQIESLYKNSQNINNLKEATIITYILFATRKTLEDVYKNNCERVVLIMKDDTILATK